MTTLVTGIVVACASAIGDAAETYDLTNIGTLFAFILVCAGVLVLRVKDPNRPRPFKVPFVWLIAPAGMAACGFVMFGLPKQAWERFGLWLVIGLVLYFAYGYQTQQAPVQRNVARLEVDRSACAERAEVAPNGGGRPISQLRLRAAPT